MSIISILVWATSVEKVGSNWIVQADSTPFTIEIDDIDNNGIIDGVEWDAYTGNTGGGLDQGATSALYDGVTGTSGTLYSSIQYTAGDNVDTVIVALDNTFSADPNQVAICFTKGTKILTKTGPELIETLTCGDRVFTADHGLQKIRWIGSRKLSPTNLTTHTNLIPIRIESGALGCGLPERDLTVSPNHRILVSSKIVNRMFDTDEVLVPAKKLIGIAGVEYCDGMTGVEYFHILFDEHEIIFAEGVPTESLYTGAQALKALSPEALREITTIFPEILEINYTPTRARLLPSGKQTKELVARHLKNNKDIVSFAPNTEKVLA